MAHSPTELLTEYHAQQHTQDEFVSLITLAPGGTMGDPSLTVEMCRIAVEFFKDKKIRMVVIVDKEEDMKKHETWQKKLDEMLGVGAVSVVIKVRHQQYQGEMYFSADRDLAHSSLVVGYPMMSKDLRAKLGNYSIKHQDVDFCFITAYNMPGIDNPYDCKSLVSGVGPDVDVPGLWPMEATPADKPKKVPNQYFAYLNATPDQRQLGISDLKQFIAAIKTDKPGASESVVMLCNIQPTKEEFTESEIDAMKQKYSKVIIGDKVILFEQKDSPLPALKINNYGSLLQEEFAKKISESEELCMMTGMNSFREALAAGKIPMYQRIPWLEGFRDALINIVPNDIHRSTIQAFLTSPKPAEYFSQHSESVQIAMQMLRESLTNSAISPNIEFAIRNLFALLSSRDETKLCEFYAGVYERRLTNLASIDSTLVASAQAQHKGGNFSQERVQTYIDAHELLRTLSTEQIKAISQQLAQERIGRQFDDSDISERVQGLVLEIKARSSASNRLG